MVDECCDENHLWGEFSVRNEECPQSWSKDFPNNKGHDMIINSVQPIPFKSYFFNGEKHDLPSQKKHDVIVLDDVMKRTCKLLKYKNEMKEIAEKAKSQQDHVNFDKLKSDVPEISDCSVTTRGYSRPSSRANSDFSEGIFTNPPLNITSESALNVLRSSVSTILAFVGFSTTTMLPLQLLTEVAENYIVKMIKLLHVNVEKEMLEGETGFSDPIDRTCHEMSIGSVRNLAQYFEKETLVLNSKKIKECKDELVQYEDIIKKAREEKRQKSELSFVEMDDESLAIPELHLTSISKSDMSSKPFETGLQMLQTLERQQVMNIDLSNQPGCSSSPMISLTSVKTELEDVIPIKKKRK